MAGGKGAAGCVEGVSSVSGGVRARFDDSDWSVSLQIEVVVLDEVFENEGDEFVWPESTCCCSQGG